MRKTVLFPLTAALILALVLTGCGSQGGSSLTEGGAGTVPVSLTMTDTPPAGVAVIFFQLSVTSAVLQPGNISLLGSGTTSIPVNVSELQTDVAFLGSANVAAGTYSSLTLTFAPNPQLTIFNGSGATVGTGSNACANNTVCTITPLTTNLTQTFSTAPFPVTLSADTPVGLQLDVPLNAIIQTDLSVNLSSGVSLDRLAQVGAGAPLTAIGRLTGTIKTVGMNQFTVSSGDDRTFVIEVNGSTTYSKFPSGTNCMTQGFSCLAPGQIVKVMVSLMGSGVLTADEVAFVQPAGQQVAEGIIASLSTSGTSTVMQLILERGPKDPPGATALPWGYRVAVTVPASGVTYAIDSDGFTIPDGLGFASAADLLVGQEVQVVVVPASVASSAGTGAMGPVGPPARIAFTAGAVTLEPSEITAKINSINSPDFTITTFPNFLLPPTPIGASPPVTPVQVTVETTAQTAYANLTPDSFAGLNDNSIVSIAGWLFATPKGTTPSTIAAEKVVGRPGPTPEF